MNNQEIEQLLKKTIQRKKILHSYMFIGSKITQKEEISKKFAKEILCLDEKEIYNFNAYDVARKC